MQPVARFGDTIITGHACDVTSTLIGFQGSAAGVFVNGLGIQVLGDLVAPHTILVGTACVPHPAFVMTGSSTVFAGGIPVARVTDIADLGMIITGSPDVFAG